MAEEYQSQQGNEELWKMLFAVGDPKLQKMQRLNTRLPAKPRCRLCMAPFKGLGGWIMRLKGKGRNSRNPNFCNACDKFLEAYPGGAEIDLSLLYVDIRNSTEYTQSHETNSVSQRINLFLNEVTRVITDNDGFIVAFYGDCIVAAWPPGFSGKDHAQKAFRTAELLVKNKNLVDADGESIPVGVGVHTGSVYIGTVSALKGTIRDVSIFGSNVNLTARLASHAKAMQALCSREHILAAGRQPENFDSEQAELKGFDEPVEIYSIA